MIERNMPIYHRAYPYGELWYPKVYVGESNPVIVVGVYPMKLGKVLPWDKDEFKRYVMALPRIAVILEDLSTGNRLDPISIRRLHTYYTRGDAHEEQPRIPGLGANWKDH